MIIGVAKTISPESPRQFWKYTRMRFGASSGVMMATTSRVAVKTSLPLSGGEGYVVPFFFSYYGAQFV
jgi:hypothetical protein